MNGNASEKYGSPVNIKWDTVQKEEIACIKAYRYERDALSNETGKTQDNLVGLAFSGGGIRSATFCLGVLEALKDKELLKKIDYLSTVSGGGYIGAWLSANCRRNGNSWLYKNTDWKDSIAHLRRYSNYLSPDLKILSADTWSMATIWLRNTLLVQAVIILTIATFLIFPRQLYWLFDMWPNLDANRWLTGGLFVVASVLVSGNLYGFIKDKNQGNTILDGLTFNQSSMQWLVVLFMVLGLGIAAALWGSVSGYKTLLADFAGCMEFLWKHSLVFLVLFYASLVVNSRCSIKDNSFGKLIVWLAPIPTTFLLSLMLAVIMRIFYGWHDKAEEGNWQAFVWGPPMVAFAFSMAIVMLIGMLGRQSNEHIREWWSRFAAWLAIYGFSWMVIVAATVYGPLWCATLYSNSASWKLLGGGWVGTTLAGLFAGRSISTGGHNALEHKDIRTRLKDIVAKIAPFAFIAGLLVLTATVLHILLVSYVQQDATLDSILAEPGLYQQYWQYLSNTKQLDAARVAMIVSGLGVFLLAWRVDINEFSLNAFYRSRLARCYLGATRAAETRNPHVFTGFDDDDDIKLTDLLTASEESNKPPHKKLYGPLHIINCALNLGGSSDLALHTRHSNNFTLTPLYCGSSYEVKDQQRNREQIGYMPSASYCGEDNQPTLGQAISVSGAAASPNMGYHTSQSVSFLMTLFNARLGWWFPSPLKFKCNQPSPTFSIDYLLQELFGTADEKSDFLAISDGGHFENLAAYELIRRQCKVVIVCDGECDQKLQFEGLANLIRLCEVDQLAKIDIDVSAIKPDRETGWSQSRCVVGKIKYSGFAKEACIDNGWLIYIKAAMTGNEDTAILQYKATHSDFPHETTGDQFFAEDQFESYRSLGKAIGGQIFSKWDVDDSENPGVMTSPLSKWGMAEIAENLYDIVSPEIINHTLFLHQADKLIDLWKQLSEDENLKDFDTSFDNVPLYNFCNEIIQFMENVYLSLNLEETWHTDGNKGWMELFKDWAKNPYVGNVWEKTGHTYGIKFKSFWDRRLAIKR